MSNDSTNPHKHEIGQSSLEYNGVILVFAALICIQILALLFVLDIISNPEDNPCVITTSFECLNHKVEQCLASEQYTKEQCVLLIGSGK